MCVPERWCSRISRGRGRPPRGLAQRDQNGNASTLRWLTGQRVFSRKWQAAAPRAPYQPTVRPAGFPSLRPCRVLREGAIAAGLTRLISWSFPRLGSLDTMVVMISITARDPVVR